ncbi:DUF4956 domain-containing protein [Bythopirellula goksoeyrii]|uniref:DUF4956 domain-containing protein n=1 Tax=Bythopirellula goksoeyrii TaxID=1400387 RepID=A0A5B9QHC8_9BACT|nr:DUF4956 domain-containing protein [Bythopirellula goksoeyrii]QEG36366.1 hypothetical protein Pr1d_36800 [Bythopirellula goksoeyrii]
MNDASLSRAEINIEYLDVPYFDDDIFKLLFRYLLNFVVVTVIVRFVYYKHSNNKDCLFTFFMINTMVFFICFTLKKFDLGLGMALGLFAIFGILRYRTSTIPIKEMTYLFMVIGVGVVNSLANKKMSYMELAFTNLTVMGLAAVLENISLFKSEMRETIVYEKVDLIRPENHAELVADLEKRTGLKLSRLELGEINFLRDTVSIDLYYYPHEQARPREDCIEVTMRTPRE